MRLGSLAAGIADQLSLAFRNPKKFIDNIDYTLHPKKLADKLLGLELLPPIHVHVEPHDSRQPHLNVLLPTLNPTKLTGGPNTALIIACHLAKMHIPIRVVALDEQVIANVDVLVAHLTSLSGEQIQPNSITFGSTCQADRPVAIGHRDVFLATSWTTAYRLKSVFPRMMTPEFLYLIQDFEPGFYPWSSSYAQALETYSLPFHALINQQGLADYLFQSSVGQFADPAFKDKCIVFEPAIDRTLFFSQKQ
ncbi:MAG TPA: hypothetical protein PLD10_22050, partial [Rhodopila sp.]|nr:hypothetical protein [Rhodopila sp.]